MNIRFGPAGIPLSCKGRTLKDGIEDIHALQLDAMEVQLLRPLRDIPEDLDLIKELGEELDVALSVHAPYYMDLLGDDFYIERSIENGDIKADQKEKALKDAKVARKGTHNLRSFYPTMGIDMVLAAEEAMQAEIETIMRATENVNRANLYEK